MLSRFKTVLLSLIIMFFSTVALARDGARYRVEVLILNLLEPQVAAEPVAELREFANAVDLQAREHERTVNALHREFQFSIGNPALLPPPPLRRGAQREGPWADISLLEGRSERMDEVWRNLRLSGEYRPQAFLAWEQPAEPPFPALRIHNETVLRVDDPWAHARTRRPADESDDTVPIDTAFQYSLTDGTLELARLPEPELHFALDGTVRLSRTRFLHIELDLESRQVASSRGMGIPGPPLRREHQGYLVHALQQSRQVRTGRMEYFDSPALGALVWITEIEAEEEESGE